MTAVRRMLAFLLVVLGTIVALAASVALVRPAWLQEIYTAVQPAIVIYEPGGPPASTGRTNTEAAAEPSDAPAAGKPIGTLEIPRLGLSSVVLESDEAAALLLGVGHLSDTPLPWHKGNSVLAAHRDTFFRPLAGIRRNDVIRFTTKDTELEYVVRETKIVQPTDVEVLAPTQASTLTLITCYPFHYIGPAPKRFVVTAERVEL
jgi:sortase A